MESRLTKITLHETNPKARTIKIAGDKSLNDLCELLRTKWNLGPWTKITVERCDQQPFWIEDKGDCTIATQYDPELDPRPIVMLRVDALDRTFLIEKYRVGANDPAAIWADISAKHGFPAANLNQVMVTGHPDDGQILFKLKVPISYLKINLPHFVRRTFNVIIGVDSWKSEEIISPATHNRE
jgi:hypothetical protein